MDSSGSVACVHDSTCPFRDIDSCAWEPSEGFKDVYVRVNDTGECVVSGPSDLVRAVKDKIFCYLSEGQEQDVPITVERVILKNEG